MFILRNAEELNKLFSRNKDVKMLLSKEDRDTLDDLIKELSEDDYFSSLQTFLSLQENTYSIEIIWYLHSQQIVDFTEFVSCFNWDPNHIVEALLIISESNDGLCQTILTDLLASLLILLSGEHSKQFDRHVQIIKQFLTESSSVIIKNPKAWIYVENLKLSPFLCKSIVQKIISVLLKNMLMADVGFHLDMAYEQYRLYRTPDDVYNMLNLFLGDMDEYCTYSLIQKVVLQNTEKANWKMILSLISTFVKIKSQQCHMLKVKLEELLNQTLSKSTTTTNFSLCKATLLIFRHCCLEIGLWSEYSRWYSTYKTNVDVAKVFYSLLTDLLPDDLPAALASHINSQPKLTESCVSIQTKYVRKAQAQLVKLNNGDDFMGLFKDYDDCQNRHEADIVKVLDSFNSTGQVMRVVLEAFVFRNKYYVDTFLKTLLNSQVVDNELRNKFIEKLNSMDKIPKNVYLKWKEDQSSVYFS